ncbi:hypothetical protein G3570_15980 [Balneolaceae bacterium YR4-1]|uniref:Glycosyltransferase family 1 protein n=1 Tax=Halalkalibaculum roseum TaxID=2709311 RepID=A0A6M1TD96_9BACT|nr:hypothetical protein [Halalkalibaculum roseum]NGP78143.1 hypothetical protein [Halalkalibaculum roseum]
MIAFVNPFNNSHLYSYVACLLSNDIVSKEKIVIYHNSENYDERKHDKFKALSRFKNFREWKNIYDDDLNEYSKIHFLSLVPGNAPIILDLIDQEKNIDKKIHIILTDDEVNRWRRVKQIFGKLRPSKRYKIDENVIQVLLSVDNYIINKTFGDLLKNILERDVLSTNYSFFIPDKFLPMSLDGVDEIRFKYTILFDTRSPQKVNYIRFLLSFIMFLIFNKKLSSVKIKLYTWKLSSGSFLSYFARFLETIIGKLSKLRKLNLHWSKISRMPYDEYQKLMSKVNFLILRGRGGVGGALTFLNANGILLARQGSLNAKSFKEKLGPESIFAFSNFINALKKIFSIKEDEYRSRIKKQKRCYQQFQLDRNTYLKKFYK